MTGPFHKNAGRRNRSALARLRLPRYPDYEWRVYGSDLVLVAVATTVLAAVLHDVFK